MGGWTAATEVQQEMFSHLAFISWSWRTASAQQAERRPIGFSFQCKTSSNDVEHLILWLEVVDEEKLWAPRKTGLALSSRVQVCNGLKASTPRTFRAGRRLQGRRRESEAQRRPPAAGLSGTRQWGDYSEAAQDHRDIQEVG